jgi:hypothetical protein
MKRWNHFCFGFCYCSQGLLVVLIYSILVISLLPATAWPALFCLVPYDLLSKECLQVF